jgi:hypothetical protein
MKKVIIALLLCFPLFALAEEKRTSLEGVDAPQWKDFAPVAYRDVKEPKGFAKFNDVAAYWYKRRVSFENGIEDCRKLQNDDEKFSCYQDLKVKQYQKNSDYNARLEAVERSKMYPQEMQDNTTNMYPIGGILNNFSKFQPNELNY